MDVGEPMGLMAAAELMLTRRQWRSFISLLVINGSVSFLMEGNREEMVSHIHLSGICLNGAGNRSGLCAYKNAKRWGWDGCLMDGLQARPAAALGGQPLTRWGLIASSSLCG